MSMEYAEERITEALKLTGGNKARATQQVIGWAVQDAKLLHALTKAHLNGIVAYNVDRVASGKSVQGDGKAGAAHPAPQKPKKITPEPGNEFGMEILRAVSSSSSAVFGLEAYSHPHKKGGVSQSHIDAIRQMARKIK